MEVREVSGGGGGGGEQTLESIVVLFVEMSL